MFSWHNSFYFQLMTVAQEIEYLKSQLSSNQKQYARCLKSKDNIAMQYLEQRNRELIDRLNALGSDRRTNFAGNGAQGRTL